MKQKSKRERIQDACDLAYKKASDDYTKRDAIYRVFEFGFKAGVKYAEAQQKKVEKLRIKLQSNGEV
jgi:hypothetical protein